MKAKIATVSNLLKKARESHPLKEAIYDGYRRMNYMELDKESDSIAYELIRMDIKKGDHIAVCLPNWHELTVILFAIAKVGAIMIPINTSYKESEIKYILNNAKVKAAFLAKEVEDNKLWNHFNSIRQKNKYLNHLISVRFKHKEAVAYENALQLEGQVHVEFPEVSLNDVVLLMYTSGMTGKPKGVMLTNNNLVTLCDIVVDLLNYTEDDVVLAQLPAFHLFGLHSCILCSVAATSKVVLMEKYKPEKVFQMIENEKITVHHGVPSMFIIELNHPNLKAYNLNSLRIGFTAGASVPPEIIGKIRDELHFELLTSYGMTEVSTCLTCSRIEDNDYVRSETVGSAVPGVNLKILNPVTKKEVRVGEIGEIVAQSPGLMKGYFEMPEKTAEVLTEDGWYMTGDLGKKDEEGNIKIVGRKNDLIIRGGYNIYPQEIEEYFYNHDSILEVAIVGLPDPVLGEVTCAVVTLKGGIIVTELDLKKFIQDKIAKYKVPDKIVIVPSIPKFATGKIDRLKLQEEMKNLI
ncbi:AMP-binding protein [Bacillus cereus group sp. BfR-BA-01441]|uniref:class I adenylate-forming enzyme family protein n=1 Tax=Bacillus cereus group sp. BfR-BA-01441 TaxID=2920348 RepID=UPI001F594299